MVLVAGSANLDFVVRAGHIPAPGETVLGRDFQTFPGGKGANQAVACARAGSAPTAMLLALGNDAFAAPLVDSLTQSGVKLHIVRAEQSTGTAFICVSDSAENAITVAPGANNALLADHLAQHLPSLQDFHYLLMQLEIPLPTVLAYAHIAKRHGLKVVLNAAPARALPAELLALIDILVVNEGELNTLTTHEGTLEHKLAQLQVPCVVVTLGDAGCVAIDQGQWITQTAFKVKVVDTTAAGDTFCGALVAALYQDLTMPDALRRAAAAAALACTHLGAQNSIPRYDDVTQLLGHSST